jgi:ferredoxin
MTHTFTFSIILIFIVSVAAFKLERVCFKKRLPVLFAGKPVEVSFLPSGKTIIAEQGDLIETVAKKAGVMIPFKCKQGRCNSCELRLNGKVSAKACQGALIPGGPTKKLSIVVVNNKPL